MEHKSRLKQKRIACSKSEESRAFDKHNVEKTNIKKNLN